MNDNIEKKSALHHRHQIKHRLASLDLNSKKKKKKKASKYHKNNTNNHTADSSKFMISKQFLYKADKISILSKIRYSPLQRSARCSVYFALKLYNRALDLFKQKS